MKFCKTSNIQAEEEAQAGQNENHPPNLPVSLPSKPVLEQPSQEEVYRGEIESFMLAENSPQVRNYFDLQAELSEHMRGVLLNWLVEVHQKYKLMGETYFLMVRLIDLYLAREQVPRSKLQLLGITALWIAAKYT